jgi:hypothetical protein
MAFDPFTAYLIIAIVSAGASYVQAKKAQKKAKELTEGVEANIESNSKEIPVVYGKRRVGGVRVYIDTSRDKKHQYLYMVLAMAEGEVESITDIKIDDISIEDDRFNYDGLLSERNLEFEVFLGSDGQEASTLIGNGVSYDYDRLGEIYNDPFADQHERDAADPNRVLPWSSKHKLSGIAYLALKFKWDEGAYTGIPDVTAVVKGRKVYDPRTSTTAWSDNPALCIRDYLTNERFGKGLPASAIDDVAFSQAANDLDSFIAYPYQDSPEYQYLFRMNHVVDTSKKIMENLNDMIIACRGFIPYSNGVYSLKIDQTSNSVLDIGPDQIISGIAVAGARKEDRFNQVKVNFFNASSNYKEDQAIYPEQNSTLYQQYLAEDEGEPLVDEIDLYSINNYYSAREMARLFLERSRQNMTIAFQGTSELINLEVGEVVSITHPTPAWTNKLFQVQEVALAFDGTVQITCIEYDAALYTYDTPEEEQPYVGTRLPDPNQVDPPTDLTTATGTYIEADGKAIGYIDLSWSAPEDSLVDRYELKFEYSSREEVIEIASTEYRFKPTQDNVSYVISVRAVNGLGIRSAWLTAAAVTANIDTTAPSDITGITAIGGLQSILLEWTNPSEDDFDVVRIKHNTVNTEPDNHSFVVRSNSFLHDIGGYSTTKYYWLAPVDRTGNVGNYVSGGSATTGSIDYGDVLNPPTIPEVATTAYLTLADNDAPTDTEFSTAVGRDPIENDSAIINKEYAFTYNGTAWTAVTEFIDGSLLVTDSVTASEINVTNLSSLSSDLGAVTAGSIDINSGVFTVNSSGDMTASSAVIDGNITAESLDVENATVTGTFIAPIGWSDGVYSGVINRGNLNESVKDLIDERIAEVTGGISGDFGQDDGSFSYIAQGNPDPIDPTVENITHENGKDLTVELSGSRSWNRQFVGLPDTDMGVTIILERSPAGADTWTTLTTLTDSGSSITTSGPTLIHSSTYAYSISIYHVLTDDQASGNYDYRARTTVAGSAYSVGVPIQLTVVEPATVGAGNADTLDNEDGTYYLNYNNFTNTPTIPTGFNILNGLSNYVWDATENARDWDSGLQLSFVQAGDGYPSYGTVIRAKTYDNDGGNGEIYFPYSSVYGGDQLQYRVGKYNNAGMTSFRKIWDDNQFSSTDVSNWNTAYGWGDHASAGYLTTHQDISGKADLSGATFTGIITVEQGENDGLRVADNKIRSVGDGLVINSDGIRFGDTSAGWDYDEWAGLKYYHPSKTIYFGGARASTSYWENNLGDANDTKIDFVGVTDLKHNGTTFLDSSRNLTNIGTITASGLIKGSQLASSFWVTKTLTGSGIGSSYDERVVLLCPKVETNTSHNNIVDGKISALKTGGNVCDTFDVFCHSVYNDTRATFTSRGQRENHKLVVFNYDGIKWVGIKFGFTANPYNYFLFQGQAYTNVSGNNGHQLKVISYYDSNNGVINSEIYNSIADYDGYGTSHKTTANTHIFTDAIGDTNYAIMNAGGIDIQSGGLEIGGTTVIDSDHNGILDKVTVAGKIQMEPDDTYSGYYAIGFQGTNTANGVNKIFAHGAGSDGLYLCSAPTRHIHFRTNGSNNNTFRMTAEGQFQVGNTTVIDGDRDAYFNSVTISTGNLNIRTQNEENPTDVIYLGANNGNSAGTSNDIGTGLVFAPQYTGYTKRSAGIMQIGEGNYFRSGLAFYTNNTSNATTDWSERMRLDMDGNLIVGQGSISHTNMDNTSIIGTNSNNKLHVNGSIQLTNNNDAIVFGRGTATFLKDEELGFGWGGGLYMTDGTWLRTRGNKGFYNGTGTIRTDGAFDVGGTTVIDSSRNMYPNVIDMGSGHAQGYKFHGRSYSWNSAMQSPTTKMPHIWQEDYSGWDPVIGIKTTNGFWQMGAYSSNEIHNGYMGGAYGGHSTNSFDTSWSYTPTVFKIGNVGTMSLTVSGSITANSNITAYSDRRLKDNIKTLDGSKVYEMRGVSFTKDGEQGSGVIAQELEKVAPELVMTNDDEMQTKSVAYGNVVGYLIEAIKELKSEIEVLKNDNDSN